MARSRNSSNIGMEIRTLSSSEIQEEMNKAQDESISSDEMCKKDFTDAINHCLDLLLENDLMTSLNSSTISRKSAIIGQEMYEFMKQVYEGMAISAMSIKVNNNDNNNSPVYFNEDSTNVIGKNTARKNDNGVNIKFQCTNDEEAINVNIIDQEVTDDIVDDEISFSTIIKSEPYDFSHEANNIYCDPMTPTTTITTPTADGRITRQSLLPEVSKHDSMTEFAMSSSDESSTDIEKFATRPKKKRKLNQNSSYNYIPLEEKMKVVNLARTNPNLSISELNTLASSSLRNYGQLEEWMRQVDKGGTSKDKINSINQWTFAKFTEYMKTNKEQPDHGQIRSWALDAARIVKNDTKFLASESWIKKFKKAHGIDST